MWGLPWEGVRGPESLKGPCTRVVVFNAYLFLTVLGLRRCVWAFSSGEQGLLRLRCGGVSLQSVGSRMWAQ